ncbi:hypothetical protein BJ944DRAFT_271473 [Cunninghamella echinulata]|nr:hypothetical protein BJ944DRAFT_271473 [Cunninghamella echinulata]
MTSLFIRYNNNNNTATNNNKNINNNNNNNNNKNQHHFILPILSSPSTSSMASLNNNNHNINKPHQPKHNYTWLVFKEELWQPFDLENQFRLEQTLSLDGTFVDICDSHFPGVKRVRVFPKNNYLSYLGVKYRLSRLLQPDPFYH